MTCKISRKVQAFTKAVEKEPGKLQVRFQFIDAFLKSGETSRVGPACDEMLKHFRNTGDHLQTLGVEGFCRLARAAVTNLEKLATVHERVTTTDRLQVLRKARQLDLISQYRAKVAKDKPTDAVSQFILDYALREEGKPDEASAAYRESIRIKPTSAPPWPKAPRGRAEGTAIDQWRKSG